MPFRPGPVAALIAVAVLGAVAYLSLRPGSGPAPGGRGPVPEGLARHGTAVAAMADAAGKFDEKRVVVLKALLERDVTRPAGDAGAAARIAAACAPGDPEMQVACLAPAVAADAANPELLERFGRALLGARRNGEAVEVLEAALSLSPGRATAWSALGEAYAARGRTEHATGALINAWRYSAEPGQTIRMLAGLRAAPAGETLQQAATVALWALQGLPLQPAPDDPPLTAGESLPEEGWERYDRYGMQLLSLYRPDASPGAGSLTVRHRQTLNEGVTLRSVRRVDCGARAYRVVRIELRDRRNQVAMSMAVDRGDFTAATGPFAASFLDAACGPVTLPR